MTEPQPKPERSAADKERLWVLWSLVLTAVAMLITVCLNIRVHRKISVITVLLVGFVINTFGIRWFRRLLSQDRPPGAEPPPPLW